MSLISDALKKIQNEREIGGNKKNDLGGQHLRGGLSRLNIKRMIILIVPVVVVGLLIYFTLLGPKEIKPLKTAAEIGMVSPAEKPLNLPVKDKSQQSAKLPRTNPVVLKAVKKEVETKRAEVPQAAVSSSVEKIQKINPLPQTNSDLKSRLKTVDKPDLLKQANQYLSEKKYHQAITVYKDILLNDKSQEVYLKLFTAYKRLKNEVLADFYIGEGLKSFPDSFYLNKIAAITSVRKKEYLQAVSYIQAAMKGGRQDYSLNTYLGLCYFHQKQYGRALEEFQKSLRLNIKAVENYYYIGLIYDNKKNYKKGLKFYKLFLRLNPQGKNFRHKNWIISRIKILEKGNY